MGIFDQIFGTSEDSSTDPIVDDSGDTVEDRLAKDAAEFEAFLKRTKAATASMVEQGIDPTAPEGFVPSTTPDGSIDVTNQVVAAREPTRDYDWFYGEEPKLGFLNHINASIADIFNPEDIPNATQQERNAYKIELEAFDARAAEIYDSAIEYTLPEAKLLGVDLSGMADDEAFPDGKVRIYKYLDENDEVAMTLVPNPSSNAFTRIIGQAGRDIWTQIAGLVEREDDGSLDLNYLEQSDYAKGVPNYDQGMGEGLLTDLLVFGVPGVAAEKLGRGTVKQGADILKNTAPVKKIDDALGTGRTANRIRAAGNIGENALAYSGGAIAIALTEGVLSEEGDAGLIFQPDEIKSTFTSVDDEEAADLAMFLDGLVVNSGFDVVLGLGAKAIKIVKPYLKGGRGLVDKAFVENAATRAALLGVITKIDPSLSGKTGNELSEAIRTLAKVLDANSTQLATVGSSTAEISVDTVNALATGAKNYIEVTRQSLQKTMSPEDWAKYIEKEANSIVSNTIGIARGNLDNAGLRDKQAEMVNSTSNIFDVEAGKVNPENISFNETVGDLVETRNLDLQEIDAEIGAAETQATGFRAESGAAVANDPLIKEMMAEVDPSRFFDDSVYVDQLTNLYGKTFVDEYRSAYKSVREAYEAIPNEPIDMISFKTQLANVFTSSGGLGEVTQDGAPILAKLQQVFGDKIQSTTDDLLLADPREAVSSALNPQQLIDGLSDDIGFQDLYLLKKEIDKLISSTNNRNVAASLRDLRDHITSKAVDDAGEATGQLAYVSRNGGQAAELAQAADDLFITTQSKFQNSMTTQNLSEASFVPAYAGTNTPIPEGGSRRGQPDLETNAVANTGAVLGDATGNQLEQLQFSLSDALSKGEVNKPFIDLFVAKQTDRLAKALRNNDNQTIEAVDAAFEGVIDQLRRLDSPLVEELNAAKSRILKVQDELGNRALAADEVADMARLRRIEAENTIVGKLTSNFSGGAKSTPSMTIRRMLSGDDAGGAIDALMAEINKLPTNQQASAKAATQSMLLRTVKDLVTTATDIAPGGKKDVALGALAKITNERASGLIDAVSRAFPNDEIMKETMMATLGSLSDLSLAARMKVARSGSDTAANLGIRDSVSTGILFVFGYMNPTAAAARRITASQIESMERLGKEKQQEIIGIILSAPEEFAELARLIAKGEDPSLLKLFKDNFLNIANRAAQYELRVTETGGEDKQMRDMLVNSVDSAASLVR